MLSRVSLLAGTGAGTCLVAAGTIAMACASALVGFKGWPLPAVEAPTAVAVALQAERDGRARSGLAGAGTAVPVVVGAVRRADGSTGVTAPRAGARDRRRPRAVRRGTGPDGQVASASNAGGERTRARTAPPRRLDAPAAQAPRQQPAAAAAARPALPPVHDAADDVAGGASASPVALPGAPPVAAVPGAPSASTPTTPTAPVTPTAPQPSAPVSTVTETAGAAVERIGGTVGQLGTAAGGSLGGSHR